MPHDRQIKPREMEYFYPRRVAKKFHQIRRFVTIAGEFHQMRIAIAIGKLHQAQPVALVIQPHRLGIDGNIALKREVGRQIAFMQDIGDKSSPLVICTSPPTL